MRALLIPCMLVAALVAADAGDRPERLVDRPAPTVKLKSSIGWRLSGVATMDLYQGAPVLVIEGDVYNVSDQERPSPKIRFGVRDAQGREMYHWTVLAVQPRIKPGDYASFEARLESPPGEMDSVEISTVELD